MKELILFGGYTKRIGKGIYSLMLDARKKKLDYLQLIAIESSPTYLAVDQKNHLYTVGAIKDQGGIAAFDISKNKAILLNHIVEKNRSPLCYLAVDEKRNLVYGSNFHQGIVYVYKKNEDGYLELANFVQHVGISPHVHYSDLTPEGRLVVCDLGNDSVYTYDVTGNSKLTEIALYKAAVGAGSRHLVFHPNQCTAYLICELNSTIEILDYNKKSGKFFRLKTISTIPDNFTKFNSAAAIRVSKDGKFLYASNRGHNSIVSFKINSNGKSLSLLEWTDTKGDFPRDFNFSQEENFLIVANQKSDNITLFSRNKRTGQLTLQQENIFLPAGTCVCPIKNAKLSSCE
ncbi:MAG: beta-propeller fold lactonase family protein [Lactobacillales bacterium]|nr:beta-propeller fold lactonase family protein [Lactobacillales bacterium]